MVCPACNGSNIDEDYVCKNCGAHIDTWYQAKNEPQSLIDERKRKKSRYIKLLVVIMILFIILGIKSFEWSGFLVVLFFGISFIAASAILLIFNSTCERCSSFFSMQQIGKREVGRMQTTVQEKRTATRYDGTIPKYSSHSNDVNKTYTYNVDVPATKIKYVVTKRCSHCGYTKDYTQEKVVKNSEMRF